MHQQHVDDRRLLVLTPIKMRKVSKRVWSHYVVAFIIAAIGASLASSRNEVWIFVLFGFIAVAVGAPGVFLFLKHIDSFADSQKKGKKEGPSSSDPH